MNFSHFRICDLPQAKMEVQCSRLLVIRIDRLIDQGDYETALERQKDLNRSLEALKKMREEKTEEDRIYEMTRKAMMSEVPFHHMVFITKK
ncbi:hypothetical protein CEY16_05555 [Halalkalibacillus sediminis]|uniref:Uncharacterized protein n=1 Tax=Halalkalibacillus sediminis TaxID=2018042 RepID=A0A2I0QY01_9BACI|nr:hypothetical protein [Halalkalibacillus sediminis]PKR79207.1 hypothetical protein CEY16_05555 [Halalkalibacillus sediminis]